MTTPRVNGVQALRSQDACLYQRPENHTRVRKFEPGCSSCIARRPCLAGGVPPADLERVQNIVYVRRPVKQGEALYSAGDECNALYAVWRGFFKTTLVDGDGRGQVTGFFMAGDLLGMDAIGSGRHGDTAISLEDSHVCVMPYVLVEPMAREVPALQRGLHAALSREIAHNHRAMMVLGSMRAEERMATFLLNLSRRLPCRGLSGCELQLRMTRYDIGSYLGLALETVSRLLSIFQRNGLLQVHDKHVHLLDIAGLESILQKATGLPD
jgi:CRP/FNR family transcriptional regulator, anaerobic regulatory protein